MFEQVAKKLKFYSDKLPTKQFYVVSYFSKTYLLVGNLNLYLTNENEKIVIEAMGATIFSSLVQKTVNFF